VLDPIAEDVFAFTDDLRLPGGMKLPSRTTLVRRAGKVLIHSPLAIDDARAAEIEALGDVDAIVAPSCIHYLFLAKAIARWPNARVLGAPGLEKKIPGVAFEALPTTGEIEGLRVRRIEGFPYIGEHVFLDERSGTLIVTDLVFNVHAVRDLGMKTFLRAVGAWNKTAQSRMWRYLFARDVGAGARSARDILAWDFDRVVVAHGDVVTTDAKSHLSTALAWLALNNAA
jgi:hypothetical protein